MSPRYCSHKQRSDSILGRGRWPAQLFAAAPPGVVAKGKGTGGDILDIYGPVTAPINWLLIGVIIVLVIAVLAAALFFFIRRFRRKETIVTATPPSTKALNELEQAVSATMPHDPKVFAELLSEILRRYIEARFSVHSTRQTTREFLENIGNSQNPQVHALRTQQQGLKELLQLCDLAKYAHKRPETEIIRQMADRARSFITQTAAQEDKSDANP